MRFSAGARMQWQQTIGTKKPYKFTNATKRSEVI
jgi:hypothetical protein